MPQLAQRVEQDKKANGGIPQDLRQLMALNDMTKAGNSAGIQSALNQPIKQNTVADDIRKRAQQVIQTKMAQAVMQDNQKQGNVGLPAGLPQPQNQPKTEQGIDQLPTNVGEYAHGGIIGYAGGDYVDERDTLRRIEAQAYEENNPPPKAPVTSADIIMQAMMADPAARRKEAEDRRNAIQRDTSSHDRLIAEYQAEKERLNAPKEGYAAFMDYVSKIAQAPRGMGSLSAGAYGAQKVNEEQEALAAKRHDLSKQMLDISQKKADVGYQQKMDVFGAGESAEAAAIKARYEAAINHEANTFEKQKLAQQMELELKKLAADKERTAVMNKPAAFQQIYTELQRLQPDADKSKLFQQAVSMAGLSAKQDSAEAQMLDKLNDAIKQYDAAEAKLNFVKITDPKQYAIDKGALDKKREETEKLRSQLYSRIGGGGLPDLNKANPAASTAAPGQPDYSKLWK